MGDAQLPITTIPPFADTNKLPACAVGCDALYAANGGCVPPAAPTAAASVYTSCFCANAVVAPLSTAATGVCEVCDEAGMSSVASWFRDICSVGNGGSGNGANGNGNGNGGNNGGNGGNNDDDAADATTTDGSRATSDSDSSGGGGGGDWLSDHWKWVVMIVILVVAIVGIWIGACIWRRRYLKRKDRQSSLGQKHSGSVARPSWGPPMTTSGNVASPSPAFGEHGSDRGSNRGSKSMFMPGAAPTSSSVFEEEKPREKKKWMVRERT